MLIAWAQNKTWDAEGRRVGSDKGYSNYECGVKINQTVLWEGVVEGHLRKSGAGVLLRRIAMEMEKDGVK
jgi:hypothetical protein